MSKQEDEFYWDVLSIDWDALDETTRHAVNVISQAALSMTLKHKGDKSGSLAASRAGTEIVQIIQREFNKPDYVWKK